jgi:hypothetical protein
MGRPPSKLVTKVPLPTRAGKRPKKNPSAREDYFTRAELVALEQSWHHGNPGAGKMAFYRWYAEQYLGVQGKAGVTDIERVRQLLRDAKVRAREDGWLEDPKKTGE